MSLDGITQEVHARRPNKEQTHGDGKLSDIEIILHVCVPAPLIYSLDLNVVYRLYTKLLMLYCSLRATVNYVNRNESTPLLSVLDNIQGLR